MHRCRRDRSTTGKRGRGAWTLCESAFRPLVPSRQGAAQTPETVLAQSAGKRGQHAGWGFTDNTMVWCRCESRGWQRLSFTRVLFLGGSTGPPLAGWACDSLGGRTSGVGTVGTSRLVPLGGLCRDFPDIGDIWGPRSAGCETAVNGVDIGGPARRHAFPQAVGSAHR